MKNLGKSLNNTRHVVFDSFITDNERISIEALINEASMEDSTIYTTDKKAIADTQIRKSKSRVISRGESQIVDIVTDRLLNLIYTPDEISRVGVAIDLVKYKDKGFLKEHQDPFMDGRKPNREFTAIIYLKDPMSGGNTVYPNLKLSIRPKKNRMFLFKNIYNGQIDETSVHYGEKTVGEKAILVFFLNELV
jgi:prolyl 4-hydroxylase